MPTEDRKTKETQTRYGGVNVAGDVVGRDKTVTRVNWQDRVVIDPKILVGKPVIKGTRLAVEFIIDLLAQGWNEAEILLNYPVLTHTDIQACLNYASEVLRAEKVYPLTTPLG
jgi:uncharacterized protein (DUF433 family)